MKNENPLGLNGIEFIEFSSPNPEKMEALFYAFGFSKTMKHGTKDIYLFRQNEIVFLLNLEANNLANRFAADHGPSVSAMGWKVKNASYALQETHRRGAEVCTQSDYMNRSNNCLPAIYGIGRSLIYLIDDSTINDFYESIGFVKLAEPVIKEEKGFISIDHLTNNVEKGKMQKWANFYKRIFDFQEVRYFDIRGAKTGLQSFALRSPCGKFCIPINEGTEDKSQINEYLREYKGPGIQHIAFLTRDILESLNKLQGSGIETLDIDEAYYAEVFDRVPNVTEDHQRLQDFDILIDGDDEGYLLQIFTKNLFGPIFIEIIQRKNHQSFGEGNFGALFRSIERDQEKRGAL